MQGEAEDDAPKGPAHVKVTLTGFKADSKIKLIKEIKTIMAPADPKFNLAAVSPCRRRTCTDPLFGCAAALVSGRTSCSLQASRPLQAKKFVEGAPSVLKEDISPEEANKLKEALEAIGGEIKLE